MDKSLSRVKLAHLILFFLALAGSVGVGVGVHIDSLRVPEVVLNGTEESILLDCDYSLDRSEASGLVLTWYLNGHIIYQWIYQKKPQELGPLRGRLDTTFRISDDDLTMHRALQINNPTTELSGEYSCKVSTFESEALKKARMIVYAPPKDWGVKIMSKPKADFVNVSCWAEGVFPEPKLTIYYDSGNREEKVLDDVVLESSEVDDAYNVRVYKVIDIKDLAYPTVFDCELKIPNTSFVARNHTLFTGPGELTQSNASSMLGAAASASILPPLFVSLLAWTYVTTLSPSSSSSVINFM